MGYMFVLILCNINNQHITGNGISHSPAIAGSPKPTRGWHGKKGLENYVFIVSIIYMFQDPKISFF